VRLVVASVVIAVLVSVASLLGLLTLWPYAQEAPNWALQARGQDIGNLIAVVVLLVSAINARRGSSGARQVWIGTLLYLLYAYVVYGFAVHLGRLFLVYVAILGLVVFTLIDALFRRDRAVMHPAAGARRFGAWVLICTGGLFGLLWLSEVVPAAISGQMPPSLITAGLIVNPIHVIDLAVVLPGMILIGILGLRGNETAQFWTVPALVFSVLMGSSILAAMALILAGGDTSGIVPLLFVCVVVLASLAAAVAYIRPAGGAPASRADVPVAGSEYKGAHGR